MKRDNMIDLEKQRAEVEELKRKIRRNKKPSLSQENRGDRQRREVETTEAGETLNQGTRREDTMWNRQSHAEMENDQKVAEAGQRWLQALETELRNEEEESRREKERLLEEEEERQMEQARLRAEELKKRSKEPARANVEQPKETAKEIPDEPSGSIPPFNGEGSKIFQEVLLLAYRNGKPASAQEDILASLRQRLGLTDNEQHRLEQNVRLEIYSRAMADAWRNGVGTRQAFEKLDVLREELSISADDHMRLERQARRQTLRRTAIGNS